jgi:hypothetical protein
MASVYSKNLQVYSAEQFKSSLETGNENLYFSFGRVPSWTDDNNPPQANTSVAYFYDVWKNMLGVKRLQGNDVRLATRRNNWTANSVYHAYDDCGCSSLYNDPNVKFFVVTNDWNVYKCISNNKGSISTVQPTSTITSSSIETSDNYIWKYMYTLSDEDRLRFTTNGFIPIKKLNSDNGSLQWQVQDSSIFGSIESVVVSNAGSGYSVLTPPTISILGDGKDATAIATINATSTGIERITITNKGSGYTYANVAVSVSVANSAALRAVMSPPGGHGHNPVEELGGSNVVINIRLRGTEEGILDVQNEIRQVAILRDPKLSGGLSLASNLVYSQTTTVFTETGISDYLEDEYVYQGPSLENATFRGTVASWDPVTRKLELLDTIGNIKSEPLTGYTTKVSRSIVGSPIDKDLEPFTGSLLYIDNIKPIQRADDQTEDFKIVISF